MSPATQLLLCQIMLIIARMHANTQYQVHAGTYGNVQELEIRIFADGATWLGEIPTPTPVATARIRWSQQYDWMTRQEHSDAKAKAIKEMEFLRAALHAYLPVDATPIDMEAAT